MKGNCYKGYKDWESAEEAWADHLLSVFTGTGGTDRQGDPSRSSTDGGESEPELDCVWVVLQGKQVGIFTERYVARQQHLSILSNNTQNLGIDSIAAISAAGPRGILKSFPTMTEAHAELARAKAAHELLILASVST